ncbi:MAG: hypothetical protein ABIR05_00015, partial [Luteimonas sp.]
ACSPKPAATFAERAAQAQALENTPVGMAYITDVLKEHGESINRFAGECYAGSPLKKDTFTLVADIDPQGNFENVDVQPDSAPTRCYALKIDKLQVKANRPVGYSDKPFPLVFNFNYNK